MRNVGKQMHSIFCYPKPVLYSKCCNFLCNNLHNNSPMQRARGFTVYHIFSKTRVGILNILDPVGKSKDVFEKKV